MISLKYTELFDVEILHEFYVSGKSADFQFQPTESCQNLLRRYNLIFRSGDTGFTIYSEVAVQNDDLKMKTPFKEKEKFTFLMKLKNPKFLNFSELPLDPGTDSFYYFNNLVNNIHKGDPLLVSSKSAKSVSNEDIYKKVGRYYTFNHAADLPELTGELKSSDSGESITENETPKDGVFNFNVDTIHLPEGRGEFRLDGSKQEDFYLAHTSINEEFFGIIEIFYDGSLATKYQFMNPDATIKTIFYKIPFDNRAATWRYILNKREGTDLSKVKIEKKSPSIPFTKDALSTSEKVIYFTNVPQKLSEEPVTGIKLINDESEGDVIIANLPNPSGNLIKKEGDKIFTDILIKV